MHGQVCNRILSPIALFRMLFLLCISPLNGSFLAAQELPYLYAPPFPAPTGNVARVSTESQLQLAISLSIETTSLSGGAAGTAGEVEIIGKSMEEDAIAAEMPSRQAIESLLRNSPNLA